jgi:hypothetical protein
MNLGESNMPKIKDTYKEDLLKAKRVLVRLGHRVLEKELIDKYYKDFKPNFISYPKNSQEEMYFSLVLPEYSKQNILNYIEKFKFHKSENEGWNYILFLGYREQYKRFKNETDQLSILINMDIPLIVIADNLSIDLFANMMRLNDSLTNRGLSTKYP